MVFETATKQCAKWSMHTQKSHWKLFVEMTCVVQLWTVCGEHSNYIQGVLTRHKVQRCSRQEIVKRFLPHKQFALKILYLTFFFFPTQNNPVEFRPNSRRFKKQHAYLSWAKVKGEGKNLGLSKFPQQVKGYAQKNSDNICLALLVSHRPKSSQFIMY